MIIGEPVGLVAFYPDHAIPRTPSIAIASGIAVFVYRSLRPYLKFTLPSLPINTDETAAWETLKVLAAAAGGVVTGIDAAAMLKSLTALRDAGVRLSARALDAVAAPDSAGASAILTAALSKPLVQHTVVTALAAIAREREGDTEASSLIVGTEAGQVLLLDAIGSSVASTISLPSPPTQIIATGALSGEHRIFISARDGIIYAVREGKLLPTRLQPPALPVAIARCGNTLVVACADSSLVGFAWKGGAPLYRVHLPSPPITMCRMLVRRDRGADCVVVALQGGALHFYTGGSLVSTLIAPDAVVALAFGQYGREGNALALTLRSGALILHLLRRTADLGAPPPPRPGAAPPEQSLPLAIPKKTRLALEQSARERDSAVDMHRVFQRGLLKLKLTTAKEFLRVLVEQGGPAAAAKAAAVVGGAVPLPVAARTVPTPAAAVPNLNVACEVLGLGPAFALRVSVTNAGGAAVNDAAISFESDASGTGAGAYALPVTLRLLPPLLPGATAIVDIACECADPAGAAGEVLVHVLTLPAAAASALALPLARAPARPVASAIVHLPAVGM